MHMHSIRVEIREFTQSDDVVTLTHLIHSAYAPHAEYGLRYWGTHQSVDDTRKRISSGTCFLALIDGRVVGTGLFRPPQPQSPVELYRDPQVWTLAQFCVLPEFKGRGIGRAIHDHGLRFVEASGGLTIALDTAEPAKSLIEMYSSWGYKLVGSCDWRPNTNYTSVLMSRPIVIDKS